MSGREFRDWSRESLYPFDDLSTMTGAGGLAVPESLFLDMIVTADGSAKPPFHVSALTGLASSGQFDVVVSDGRGSEVGRAGLSPSTRDDADLVDGMGMKTGSVVFDRDEASKMARALFARTETFAPGAMRLLASRCYAVRRRGVTRVGAGDDRLFGDIVIAGAGGVRFDLVDGKVVLSYEGTAEDGSAESASADGCFVKTVNNIALGKPCLSASHMSSIQIKTDGSGITLEGIENVK